MKFIALIIMFFVQSVVLQLLATKSSEDYLSTKSSVVYDFVWVDKGSMLIAGEDSSIVAYSSVDFKVLWGTPIQPSQVISIAISPDSAIVASGCKDGTMTFWNVKTGHLQFMHKFNNGYITSLSFNPNGLDIAVGMSDKSVIIFDLESKIIKNTINDAKSDIHVVTYNPKGTILAVGGYDGMIRLYNSDFELQKVIEENQGVVRDLSFKNDSTMIVGTDNAYFSIYNIDNNFVNKSLFQKRIGGDWILSTDTHQSGGVYAVGFADGKLKVVAGKVLYSVRLSQPITKVMFVKNSSSIDLFVATYGAGIKYLKGRDLRIRTDSKLVIP